MCFRNVAQLRSTLAQICVYYTAFQVSLQAMMCPASAAFSFLIEVSSL